MSDRLTSIHLKGVDTDVGAWCEWGRKDTSFMLVALKERARRMKEQAEAVLAASDHEFTVRTYVGVHVQRKTEVLQWGRAKP